VGIVGKFCRRLVRLQGDAKVQPNLGFFLWPKFEEERALVGFDFIKMIHGEYPPHTIPPEGRFAEKVAEWVGAPQLAGAQVGEMERAAVTGESELDAPVVNRDRISDPAPETLLPSFSFCLVKHSEFFRSRRRLLRHIQLGFWVCFYFFLQFYFLCSLP